MIVEQYRGDIAGLVLPENMKFGEGDTFIVKAVGPGYHDFGTLISYDIKVGDRVMVAGKIMHLPGEKRLLLARQTDVLAIERDDNLNKKEPSDDTGRGAESVGHTGNG